MYISSLDWLGKGTSGTCQVMWYAGMTVAIKTSHHQSIRVRNILMEAKMLEMSNYIYGLVIY